jgi:hypothetical protein
MRNGPVIGRQVYQSRRNFADVFPWPVIIFGSEPAPLIRPIPPAMVKKEVRINTRHKIYIPSWYGNDFGWPGKFHARRCLYACPDFYTSISYIDV